MDLNLGSKFGRWVVLKVSTRRYRGTRRWCHCQCSCGKRKEVEIYTLTSGKSRSCGCLRSELIRKNRSSLNKKKYPREHTAYGNARTRCTNPNTPNFPDYGGRGIRMCKRWMESFDNFIEDMGQCPEHYTLERADNDKGYSPGNCSWVSKRDNCRNKRTNRIIEFEGRSLTLIEWSEEAGIPYKTLHMRLKRGWTMKASINTPVR